MRTGLLQCLLTSRPSDDGSHGERRLATERSGSVLSLFSPQLDVLLFQQLCLLVGRERSAEVGTATAPMTRTSSHQPGPSALA